jgi:hypothetical protein
LVRARQAERIASISSSDRGLVALASATTVSTSLRSPLSIAAPIIARTGSGKGKGRTSIAAVTAGTVAAGSAGPVTAACAGGAPTAVRRMATGSGANCLIERDPSCGDAPGNCPRDRFSDRA